MKRFRSSRRQSLLCITLLPEATSNKGRSGTIWGRSETRAPNGVFQERGSNVGEVRNKAPQRGRSGKKRMSKMGALRNKGRKRGHSGTRDQKGGRSGTRVQKKGRLGTSPKEGALKNKVSLPTKDKTKDKAL